MCTTHSPYFKTITASAAARLPSPNMPPKRPVMLPSVAKKTRKSHTLKVKLDIIHRHERGKKTNSIARHHGLTPSTVSTILKSADSIKKTERDYNTPASNPVDE
ncbi:CENPB DNA-binding domain-containing protein 1 [Portunus trituberculatus]|uniref:CENPB DNA-binding domain-containing protein 1 n=1 Tax=Portunus trituberculatus TaxID=210409 RepID=A0A5B7F7F3_PORTR|nr:CENPB DNA-binding domain-containing protein 1 [Portunus trituberculatus]